MPHLYDPASALPTVEALRRQGIFVSVHPSTGHLPDVFDARALFGAAYYPEYLPPGRMATDLPLMRDASFSVIRVGESVWSTWEPEEGVFNLEWLQPVLDGAHEHGLRVIVGTPTYAAPPWLRHQYPETTAHRRTGVPIPYGHRQDIDFTAPAFRFLAARLVREIVARYSHHPAVIGYQVDNEPGIELLHNPAVFDGFVNDLRAQYGDVRCLNEAWGLTYWSHRISRWDELWRPDGNTVPAYALAWRRYQARLTTEFIAWQAGIVREGARPDQFVMTCLALGLPAIDPVSVSASLDVTAINPYYGMQDSLTMPRIPPRAAGGRPEWLVADGTWAVYLQADTAWGARCAPFLVAETNATSIGEPHVNYPAFDGQWRQAAWALVARGAAMVEYWHWHTLHQGHESYWGGVLGHSLEPGRCYRELSQIGAELSAAGASVVGLVPDAEVVIVVDAPSRWAMEFQPPLARDGGPGPDRRSYDRIVGAFYQGLFEAGISCAVRAPSQLPTDPQDAVRRWPILLAPALYVASDELLCWLRDYALGGGHLVIGLRTGYADELACPRPLVMPGVLAEVTGATYTEFTNLAVPVPVTLGDGLAGLVEEGACATAWADMLQPTTAESLAGYDAPHLRGAAAITTNRAGAGRVTYVGTVPDADLAVGLGRWLRTTSLVPDCWAERPGSVTVTGATNTAGRRLSFVSNWSWSPVSVPVPVQVDDLLRGGRLEAGEALELGPWDVRVLMSAEGAL
jgi:beta-galactosidase